MSMDFKTVELILADADALSGLAAQVVEDPNNLQKTTPPTFTPSSSDGEEDAVIATLNAEVEAAAKAHDAAILAAVQGYNASVSASRQKAKDALLSLVEKDAEALKTPPAAPPAPPEAPAAPPSPPEAVPVATGTPSAEPPAA